MSMREHRWIAKALAQKTISKLGLLPLYHQMQHVAGRLKDFHPASRIEYAGKLATDVGLEKLQGAIVVEIGTGWVPVVPMGLHLLGAREIHSFDLNRHLQPELSSHAADMLPACFADLARRSGATEAGIRSRYAALAGWRSWDELSSRMGFRYYAPVDVTRSDIPPASVDIVYSNLVLEHVTVSALESIVCHSRRILKPSGVCWHNIDFTDHYAATHRALSPINFLRYGDGFWESFGQNDILYQNRLRRSDYLRAFSAGGFQIVRVVEHSADKIEELRKIPLSDRFRKCDDQDLLCGSMRFVLKRE